MPFRERTWESPEPEYLAMGFLCLATASCVNKLFIRLIKKGESKGLELLLPYLGVLLVIICLEGLLAADNAVVLALMVSHLPEEQRKKALFYGLVGAMVLRFGSLFIISFLVNVWQVQALGAIYLLIMSIKNLYTWFREKKHNHTQQQDEVLEEATQKEFWWTVFKVECADLVFAIDSILAAVALGVTLPKTDWGHIGGLDTGHFLVVFIGGLIGVIIMRFAANIFVDLLHKRPNLEGAAYLIVGWVGIKLLVMVLSHEDIAWLPKGLAHSTPWQVIFYGILVAIGVIGWFSSKGKT